jgi:hypothetical protein
LQHSINSARSSGRVSAASNDSLNTVSGLQRNGTRAPRRRSLHGNYARHAPLTAECIYYTILTGVREWPGGSKNYEAQSPETTACAHCYCAACHCRGLGGVRERGKWIRPACHHLCKSIPRHVHESLCPTSGLARRSRRTGIPGSSGGKRLVLSGWDRRSHLGNCESRRPLRCGIER